MIFGLPAPGFATNAITLLVLAPLASAQVLNPANGHYYLEVVVAAPIDWVQAHNAASASVFMGMRGHLATISDQAENNFVSSVASTGVWLGGLQDFNDPGFSEPAGGWKWVTGEPMIYTSWASIEPNNHNGVEHHLQMCCSPNWNDEGASPVYSYMLEYEPATTYCGPATPNSTGSPGAIAYTGSPILLLSDLRLYATQLPPGAFGYFLTSRTQGFAQPSVSQGTLCLSGTIGRFSHPLQIIQGPQGSLAVNLNSLPTSPPVAAASGETWNFQCWYRDLNPGPTSNFTDALSIMFE